MQKMQLIARKPAYRHGQLLLEEDFIAEQQFHADSHYRHLRHLHGFGVVSGLEVSRDGDLAVAVSPGFAVDRRGHEIELATPETLELTGLPAGALAWVTIGYRTEHVEKGREGDNRIGCFAYLRVATGVEQSDVRLGRVQLDERGRLGANAVSHAERDRLQTILAPGSVTAASLDEQLRSDWITMPFHPSPIPLDAPDTQPPFRVGATETKAHKKIRDYSKDGALSDNPNGAAGTMAIILPPGIRHVRRFRVAGAANEKSLTVVLVKGGFDPQQKKHIREEVAKLEIGTGGYFETVDIAAEHQHFADRNRTLAVDIRSKGYAEVSLIALEVSY